MARLVPRSRMSAGGPLRFGRRVSPGAGDSSGDGTAGAPLTAAGRAAGRRGARGTGDDEEARWLPALLVGRRAPRGPGTAATTARPVPRSGPPAGRRGPSVQRESGDGTAGAPLTPAGRATGRRGARGRAATKRRGGSPGAPVGCRVARRLGSPSHSRVPGIPGARGGVWGSRVVISPRNVQSGGDITALDGERTLPGRSPAGTARRTSRSSGSHGGAGLARARSPARDRAGVRRRPDQNRIRYPRPLLPAPRPRLRRPRSLRVAGGGSAAARDPGRAGAPPLPLGPLPLGRRTIGGIAGTVEPNPVLVWPGSRPGAAVGRRSARFYPP